MNIFGMETFVRTIELEDDIEVDIYYDFYAKAYRFELRYCPFDLVSHRVLERFGRLDKKKALKVAQSFKKEFVRKALNKLLEKENEKQ